MLIEYFQGFIGYSAVAAAFAWVARKWFVKSQDDKDLVVMGAMFWPLVLPVLVLCMPAWVAYAIVDGD